MNAPKLILEGIEDIRKKRNVSMYSAAKRTGIQTMTIRAIAKGTGNPTLSKLCAYCNHVGADISVIPWNKNADMRSIILGNMSESDIVDLGEDRLKMTIKRLQFLLDTFY